MQIAIHSCQYELAYDHYRLILSHKNFATQARDKRALYKLYGAFLNFLVLTGEIKTTEKNQDLELTNSLMKYQNLVLTREE